MKVIKSIESVFVDCDETLVLHITDGSESEDDLLIEGVRFKPHKRHIEQVKAHHARGHLTVVWSAGGYKWAETVVKMLGLEEHVDYVMSKPSWCIDDQPSENWIKRYYYTVEGDQLEGDEEEKKSIESDI